MHHPVLLRRGREGIVYGVPWGEIAVLRFLSDFHNMHIIDFFYESQVILLKFLMKKTCFPIITFSEIFFLKFVDILRVLCYTFFIMSVGLKIKNNLLIAIPLADSLCAPTLIIPRGKFFVRENMFKMIKMEAKRNK